MSRKITFALTINDDHEFVHRLEKKLISNGYIIELIGLGSASELENLYTIYDGLIGLDKLAASCSLGDILIFSTDTFFDLQPLLPRSDSLVVWSDPDILDDKSESYLTEVMVDSCRSSIISRTSAGQEAWSKLYNLDAPILQGDFDYFDSLKDSQPLIEKTGKIRLLLDGGDDVINNHLIEPFLQLENYDIDFWCIYPEALKLWMRPGMYFTNIPREERNLYYQSVDGVVVADVDISRQKIIDYVTAGFMPIASSYDVREKLSGFFNEDVDVCVITSTVFQDMLKKPEQMIRYNKISEAALTEEADFSLSSLEVALISADSVVASMNQLAGRFAQKDFFKRKYDNEKGSLLHQNFTEALVGTRISIEGSLGVHVVVVGWGVDKDTWQPTYPKIKHNNEDLKVRIEKKHRPDVLKKVFPDHVVEEEVGFNGHFILKDQDVEKSELEVLNFAESSMAYSAFRSRGNEFEDIQPHADYVRKSSIKGFIDRCVFNESIIFDLSVFWIDYDYKGSDFKVRVLVDGLVLNLMDLNSVLLSGDSVVALAAENNSLLFDGSIFSDLKGNDLTLLVSGDLGLDINNSSSALEVVFFD